MRSVIYAVFGASFTILMAGALGSLLLRKFYSSLHRLEERLLAIILGSACLSAIVFVLCTVGLARKGAYVALGLVAVLFAIPLRKLQSTPELLAALPRVWKLLFVTVFMVLTAAHVIRATPDVTNLSLVDQADGFKTGASLPDGIQLVLLPAFALGRQPAAALMDVGLRAALALLLFCYGRRVGNTVLGMTGAIFLYACPLANIDGETAAMIFALSYLLRLWDRQPTTRLLVAIGILSGFSYVTNRDAILAFPYVLWFIVWKLWRQGKPVLSPASAVSLPALAFIVPWIVREPLSNGLTRFPACLAPLAWLSLVMALSLIPVALVRGAESAILRLLRTTFRMPTLAEPITTPAPWFIRAACGTFVVAYFVFFAWDGLHTHFIHDDPSNIAYYWSRGTWPLIRAQFEFYSTYLRPMGGLFYLPIYHFAGFNPVPYRVVGLLIILANTALFYRVAKLVSGSGRVAWLAAILVSYHAHLMDMIYQNSNIYDVLCFLFYFAALALYLGIRARDQIPNWSQTAAIAVLYVCALDSKEMAVSLPVTLALFELLFHPPSGNHIKIMLAWLYREGRVLCIAGALTVVYLVGKTFGADPLAAMDAYRPQFTIQKFMSSMTGNMQSLFYLPEWFGPVHVTAAWAALLAFAWVTKNRYVAFCVLFGILSELPIAFIGRGGPCLYIPLAAWAMLVSAAIWASAQWMASVFRPRTVRLATSGLLVAVFLSFYARRTWEETMRLQHFFYEGQVRVWSTIQQFAKLQISPKPGARIAFLNDPLPSPTTMFLAQLRFQDPSLDVLLNPPQPPDLSKLDYVFDYRDGQFIQIQPAP